MKCLYCFLIFPLDKRRIIITDVPTVLIKYRLEDSLVLMWGEDSGQ